MASIISQLLVVIIQHFRDEEIILEAAGFPGLTQHAAEHAKLIAKGIELSQGCETMPLSVGDVFQFLVSEMIMLHILGADQEYFKCINAVTEAE